MSPSACPVFVALGSNIEPAANLARAVDLLAEQVVVRAVSPVYETAPAAGASGPAFWNAAVWVETDLPAALFKFDVLRKIETRLGRVRTADKNAPRTIDLDLVLYGAQVIDDPDQDLLLPDPDIVRWPHVALPLAALAPDFVHPVDGRTLGEVAAGMASAGMGAVRLDMELSSARIEHGLSLTIPRSAVEFSPHADVAQW